MSKGRLLLADDSVTIQKVVNLTFADEGIDVVTAGNGDTAMEMIALDIPDVVLADVNMPGLNGYQICEQLRQNDATKDIPVLLLVGSFEPFDEIEAKRVGASGFLTKPFQSIRTLVAQVSELLETNRNRNEPLQEPARETDEPGPAAQPLEEPQTFDIDDLYHQSFSSIELDEPISEQDESNLVDAGMDDEMIETSYVSSELANETERMQSTSPFEVRVSNETQLTGEESGQPSVGATAQFAESGQVEIFERPRAISAAERESTSESYANDATLEADLSGVTDGFALSDGDLLELPGERSTRPHNSVPKGSSDTRALNLSPEQIDIIVQKVIERMSGTR